jgi:hypothetical protein
MKTSRLGVSLPYSERQSWTIQPCTKIFGGCQPSWCSFIHAITCLMTTVHCLPRSQEIWWSSPSSIYRSEGLPGLQSKTNLLPYFCVPWDPEIPASSRLICFLFWNSMEAYNAQSPLIFLAPSMFEVGDEGYPEAMVGAQSHNWW